MKTLAPLAALTIHQPFAWAVAEGFKLCENRDWRPGPAVLPLGAELAIHAGMQEPDPGDLEYVLERLVDPGTSQPPLGFARRRLQGHLPRGGELVRGGVVAVARLEAVVESPLALAPNQRPWWVGRYGWVLGQVRALASPVPCRGAQGVWQLPGDVLFQVREQLP